MKDLKNIVKFVKKKGYSMICFDRDAEVINTLPV
ncbi:DUF5983 family protein [Hungatella hathewayi]